MTGILTAVGVVIVVAVMFGAVKTGKPLRSLGSSAMQGFCALAAVNVAGAFCGVTLGVTAFSAAVCAVLGIPGVITMLVLQSLCMMPM